MPYKTLYADLVYQYILTQQVLNKEQQAILDSQRIINHNLLLHAMLSQLSCIPPNLLKEFHFAIEQKDIEVILLLRRKITFVSRKILRKG